MITSLSSYVTFAEASHSQFIPNPYYVSSSDVIDTSENNLEKMIRDINTISEELNDYDKELGTKDKWFVFNKIDELRSADLKRLKPYINSKIESELFFVSAKNKSGLESLCDSIFEYIKDETKY